MRLLPSLREKDRYVLFESLKGLSFAEVSSRIIDSFKLLFGEIGLAKAGVNVVEWNSNKGIVRVAHTHVDNLRAALCACDEQFRSIKTSGTLRKLRRGE